MIIKLGNMYLSRIEYSNYDNELLITFTSSIKEAKRFKDDEEIIVKNIIDSNLVEVSLLQKIEEKEEIINDN